MLLQLALCLLLFFGLTLGLAWPVAARLDLAPVEKLVASVVLSLLATYLVAFAIYLLGLPAMTFWILPVLATMGLIMNRTALAAMVRDPESRALLIGQLLVTGWCVGWLFFIASYSGGGWTGDWYEHWERTRFFLERWPLDTKFLGFGALAARPPLANLVTGALLADTSDNFAYFQLFTALLNSLAFLPAGLLVRRFSLSWGHGANSAVGVLAVLLMLNPSFVENTTFAWTKLMAVFFILSGLYFFLRTLDTAAPRSTGPLCATALAGGFLAHYSAGPYIVLLAFAWLGLNRPRWADVSFWRQTGGLAVIGGVVLATWFGWSVAVFGTQTTLMSNSSVNVDDARKGNQLLKIALNLSDTLVPHFLRPLDGALIAQQSRWGYWRDWWFQLYQLNLFFIFGSVAWLALIRDLVRGWPEARPRSRYFWAFLSAGVILLGVAVHGARDTWGLAHICLQALVPLGLGYLATRWSRLGRGWQVALAAGAVADFVLGIALHFAVQDYALDRWFGPARPFLEILKSYSICSLMNVAGKLNHQLAFFRDDFKAPAALVLALLAGIITLALTRAARRPD